MGDIRMVFHLVAAVIAGVVGHILNRAVDALFDSGSSKADLPVTAARAWPEIQAGMPDAQDFDQRVGQLQAHGGLLEAMRRQPGILIPEDGGRFARLGDARRRFDLGPDDGDAVVAAMAPSRLLSLAPMHQIAGSDFVSAVSTGYKQLVLSSPSGNPVGLVSRRRLLTAQFTSLVARLTGTTLEFNEDEFRQRINRDLFQGLTITTEGKPGSAPALHVLLDLDQLHRQEQANGAQLQRLGSWAGGVLPETDAATVLFLCALRRPGQRLVARPISLSQVSDQIPPMRPAILPELAFTFQVAD
jgi:hypothetical protein